MTTQFNTLKLETIEKCGICLEEMLSDEVLLAHKVGDLFHTFHEECVRPAIVEQNKCPYCRMEVTHINGTPTRDIEEPILPPPSDTSALSIETGIGIVVYLAIFFNAGRIFGTMLRTFPSR